MPLLTEPGKRVAPAVSGGGPGIGNAGYGGGGGDGDGAGGARRLPRRMYFTGLLVALAPIMMLFAALASSYIVRQGLSKDWEMLQLPPMLWVNTLFLLASSAALELGRRRLKDGQAKSFNSWWAAGTVLGLVFVAGQGLVWWQLKQQGVYFTDNPSHSFFYLLTITHAVHLLGGVAALLWVMTGVGRLATPEGKSLRADLAAFYWHFMDGIWIFLVLLFLFGR
ncbi:MAG: cytochrome c oxidase subunit 3 [Planctomycetota bacterium]|nr:cytochrome c oxidase subunit 3 [Planctomycetota bacterium]